VPVKKRLRLQSKGRQGVGTPYLTPPTSVPIAVNGVIFSPDHEGVQAMETPAQGTVTRTAW